MLHRRPWLFEWVPVLPDVVLREPEVVAHDARAVPAPGTHDCGECVARDEEVLRRPHAQGVPRDFVLAGPHAPDGDD